MIAERRQEAMNSLKAIEYRPVRMPDQKILTAGYVVASGPVVLAYILEQAAIMHATAMHGIAINPFQPMDVLCIRWVDDENKKQISLRRPPGNDNVDVSKIAVVFGGNGHPPASGVQNKDYLE